MYIVSRTQQCIIRCSNFNMDFSFNTLYDLEKELVSFLGLVFGADLESLIKTTAMKTDKGDLANRVVSVAGRWCSG